MKNWSGSAAICINDYQQVLMVRGKDSDMWAVPSGGMEEGETPEQCCIREVKEETGYTVEILQSLFIKHTDINKIQVKTHYFLVQAIGNSQGIQDPDKIIEEKSWKSLAEIQTLKHMYPEDLQTLELLLKEV